MEKLKPKDVQEYISFLIKNAGYMIPENAKKEIVNYSQKIEGEHSPEEIEKEIGNLLKNYIGSILGFNIPKTQMEKFIQGLNEYKFPVEVPKKKKSKIQKKPEKYLENKTTYISGNDQPPEAIDFEEIKPSKEPSEADLKKILEWSKRKKREIDTKDYDKRVIPELSKLNREKKEKEKKNYIQIIPLDENYTTYEIVYDEDIEPEIDEILKKYEKSTLEKSTREEVQEFTEIEGIEYTKPLVEDLKELEGKYGIEKFELVYNDDGKTINITFDSSLSNKVDSILEKHGFKSIDKDDSEPKKKE